MGCVSPASAPSPGFAADLPDVDGDPGLLLRSHAHNDYEHERPLIEALEHRFYSVEVDVYWQGGELVVAHYPWENRGELSSLYLDPLVELIHERGTAYGDGHPLTLWVDLKDDSDDLVDELHTRLAAHPDVFARFAGDDVVDDAPVHVVLTGASAKARYVDRDERFAIRDSNDFNDADPAANARWAHYALNAGAVDDMAATAAAVHDKNKQVRLYAAVDDDNSWCTQLNADVDFIGTDRIADLAAFLDDGC